MKDKQYHIVYRITCRVNNKQYVGIHSTNILNDGYLGSSKLLSEDIRLFGEKEFVTEHLHLFSTRREALDMEHRIVNSDWIKRADTYNLCVGGNSYPYGTRVFSDEHRRKLSEAQSRNTGWHMSAEAKDKISAANKGNKRPDLAAYNTRTRKGVKRGPQSPEHRRKKGAALHQYYLTHWKPSIRRPTPPITLIISSAFP